MFKQVDQHRHRAVRKNSQELKRKRLCFENNIVF